MHKLLIVIIVNLLALSGCQSSFGPGSLQTTQPAYNQAISQSLSEQMLLNLVRLRYRDHPHFLKVNSITASMTFNSSVGIGSGLDLSPGGNIIQPNLGIGYSDQPTISFQPLHGEDFLKSVLSSISFDALLVMTESGWSIERVFGMGVERINDVYNAPSASGPTPDLEPEFRDFKRAMKLFRQLQLARQVELGTDENDLIQVVFKITKDNESMVVELSNLLGFQKPNDGNYLKVRIDTNFLHNRTNELKIRPRSIVSILFYLSQQIDIPRQHTEDGLVNVTKSHNGNPFNWAETPAGEFFHVYFSEDYPESTFLAVPYRGYWFFIADNDLNSKSTFMLLSQLFNLQAGQNQYVGPTLTLPVR